MQREAVRRVRDLGYVISGSRAPVCSARPRDARGTEHLPRVGVALRQRQHRIGGLDRGRPRDLGFALDELHHDRRRALVLPRHLAARREELHAVALRRAADRNIRLQCGFAQRFRVMKPSPRVILDALVDALNLPVVPKIIECFDISHIQGSDTVASMVVCEDGRMKKSAYRKFLIKGVTGVDDFASMREVVTRRYRRLQEEKKQLPGLILIDGGIGQLHSAAEALEALGIINQPLASIACFSANRFSQLCQEWLLALTLSLPVSRACTSSMPSSLLYSLWNASSLYFTMRGKFSTM